MPTRLEDKVAIVTGAGSLGPGWGNGKATAVLFAREGARVLAVDRDAAAAEETSALIRAEGGTCIVHCADVTDEAAVQRMVGECMARFGRVDVLHNNVGIARPGGPEDLSGAEWDRVFEVNAKSMFLTCKHVLPHMVAQRGGSIVNVSTISSNRVLRGLSYVAYPTSKAAVNQLTKVIAATYGRHGIRCNAILPGFMLTPMVERSVLGAVIGPDGAPLSLEDYLARRTANIPLGAWGDAWDTARAALFLASEDARYITGIELVVDGGATLLCG